MTAIHTPPPVRLGRKVAYQYPAFGPGEPLLLWARNGLVHFEDRRPNASPRTGSMSWQEAAKRVLAISRMIPRPDEDRRWNHERTRMQQFVCDMEIVIREAKEHGGPFDDMPNYDKPRRLKVNNVIRLGDCDF